MKTGYTRIITILVLFGVGCAAAADALRRAQDEDKEDSGDAEGDTVLLLICGLADAGGGDLPLWCYPVLAFWTVLGIILAPIGFLMNIIFGGGSG